MSESLYSQGIDAITRNIHLVPEQTLPGLFLDDAYEIEETAAEIMARSYLRICLQFPDELLQYSVPIYHSLKAKCPGKELFLMADTSYGSCCVDEVAAEHVQGQLIVHYGHACLSTTTKFPTIYVFPKKPIDLHNCVQLLLDASKLGLMPPSANNQSNSGLVVMMDVAYHYQAVALHDGFRRALPADVPIFTWTLPNRFVSPQSPQSQRQNPSTAQDASVSNSWSQFRLRIPADFESRGCTIFYVGGESLALNNVLMTNPETSVFSYDPLHQTCRLESQRANRLLMRRYAVTQKARDADVFGILVGTLGVASYIPVISLLRQILSRHGKKSYTLNVGKLNPAKLANFMEIECFVLVACPENSLIDEKDFFRPIITPHELLMALGGEGQWSLHYSLDFQDVLAGGGRSPALGMEFCDDPRDGDSPVFSLISGGYRHPKRYGSIDTGVEASNRSSDALTTTNADHSISLQTDSAAAQYLQTRSFRGLEQNLGSDEPSVLEQGRKGVAQGYGEAS